MCLFKYQIQSCDVGFFQWKWLSIHTLLYKLLFLLSEVLFKSKQTNVQ